MSFRLFIEPQLQGATYAQQLATAQVAEALGFEGFFRSDHYLACDVADVRPNPSDAWLTLAGIARETRSIRLGTLMSAATMRLPGPLTIQLAQLDEMSGGRVELGLGTGWYEGEHRAYGVPFPRRRFDLFEEQLQIVTGLWRTPENGTFDFAGDYYQLESAPSLQGTVHQSRLPLIIGGTGPRRTPTLAAKYADEFNIGTVRPAQAKAHFDLVRAACAQRGRAETELTYSAALVVCCGLSDAEVATRARRMGRGLAEIRATSLAGSPAEVVDKIGHYIEAGVQRLYFKFLDVTDLDHLELIGHQVLPHFDSGFGAQPS